MKMRLDSGIRETTTGSKKCLLRSDVAQDAKTLKAFYFLVCCHK